MSDIQKELNKIRELYKVSKDLVMYWQDKYEETCVYYNTKLRMAEIALSDPDNHWHHPRDGFIEGCSACRALKRLHE